MDVQRVEMDLPGDKTLIVNADDFGWSSGVNEGIVSAHRDGILTSATAMVNFPMFAHAAALAATVPRMGIGLHINIVHGPPVSPPGTVSSLLGSDARFPGASVVIRGLLRGQIVASELDRELSAQLARFRETLGEPTHVDSHKHMHVFGELAPAFIRLAGQLKAPRARCPFERVPLGRLFTREGLTAAVLNLFASRLRHALLEAGVASPDRFQGTLQSHSLTPSSLCRLLDGLRPGATELMCHPGRSSPDDHDVVANVTCTPYRLRQLTALTDGSVKSMLAEKNIALCHYGQLPADNCSATVWRGRART